MWCRLCTVRVQPTSDGMLDRADCTAPTRQHELNHTDHTDHTYHIDQEYIHLSALKHLPDREGSKSQIIHPQILSPLKKQIMSGDDVQMIYLICPMCETVLPPLGNPSYPVGEVISIVHFRCPLECRKGHFPGRAGDFSSLSPRQRTQVRGRQAGRQAGRQGGRGGEGDWGGGVICGG